MVDLEEPLSAKTQKRSGEARMYLKTAIKRLREGKPVSNKLILKWLEELEEYRENEEAERDQKLEAAGY